MKIVLIAGARPNFIKAAPLWHALRRLPDTRIWLVHTGQHRFPDMSTSLLEQLGLPEPDLTLPGNAPGAVQETARIALELEPALKAWQPDWVIVIGDVTSTLAGALAAKQSGFRVAHVEAGLRSGDLQMPEEMNRIVVDHIADLLFPGETSGLRNLEAEGIPADRIYFVGNVLIDTLQLVLPQAKKLDIGATIRAYSLTPSNRRTPKEYALLTFHRPSNVDGATSLRRLKDTIMRIEKHIPVIFPVHPRTWANLEQSGGAAALMLIPNLFMLRPVGYIEMIGLMLGAAVVVTDSGGIQEESTWLGKPCLTFRRETERPATVECGTNTLISDLSPVTLEHFLGKILSGRYKTGGIPPLWDGHAAERMAGVLANRLLLDNTAH